MPKPQTRTLSVLSKDYVTPSMLRLTLTGEELNDFPAHQESSYVKLMFPTDNGHLIRTYTIRKQRDGEIDIDFAIHGEGGGVACQWAVDAKPGDEILVGGPGPKKLASENTNWLIFVGDMTSLPAISVNLEQLSADAKGYAILEVQSEADIQTLQKPQGIELKWVINPNPGRDCDSLLEHVKALTWLDGSLALWAACEFSSMRKLRAYFKERNDIAKADLYVSSYWKMGLNEDQHKVEKRIDLGTVDAR